MERGQVNSEDLLNPKKFISKEFELTDEQAARIRPLVYECLLINDAPVSSKGSRVSDNLKLYLLTFFPGQEAIVPSINFDLSFREASNVVSEYLPGLWHAISRINNDNIVTLDMGYLNSSGYEIEDIFQYFNESLKLSTLDPDFEKNSFHVEKNPVPIAFERAGLAEVKIKEEDLQILLDNLPPIPGGTSEHRRRLEEFFKKLITELFVGESIHPDGLYLLRKQIYNLLVDAIAPANMPVGLILSDAIAAKLMQQALDRKHGAGIGKGVESGVNILREVLRALKKLKTPEMRAFFRNRRISFQEAETYKLRYEEVFLREVLTVEPEIVHDDESDPPEYPQWAKDYAELEGFTIPQVLDRVILTVDVQKLFNHGMTMRDLVAALKKEFDSQHSGMLRFLVSPRIVLDEQAKRENKTFRSTWVISYIYILPDPEVAFKQITTNKKLIDKFANYILDRNQRELRKFTYRVLLIDVISPILKRLMISGIPDIHSVEVASRTISVYGLYEKADDEPVKWSQARYERHLTKWPYVAPKKSEAPEPKKGKSGKGEEEKRVEIKSWTLFLNQRLMLLDMILAEDIKYLLSFVGFVMLPPDEPQPTSVQILDPLGSVEQANIWAQEMIDREIRALKPDLKAEDRKKKIQEITKKHLVKGPLDFVHRLYMEDVEAEKKRKRDIAVAELKEMQEYAKKRELSTVEAGMPPFPWEKFIVKQELTPLMAANRVNYLVFDGSNVKALIEKAEIDSRTIYSTNTHQMLDSFGIAVARQGIMLRLASVMGDESNYIDPSYILLMAEILCNRGKYYGTSYEGLKQQQTNVMSLMTAEQPMKALLKMAKHSIAEASTGVSAEMMLGLESRLGGGAVDLVVAEDLISEMAKNGLQFTMNDIESYLATRDAADKPTPSLNVTKPLDVAADNVNTLLNREPTTADEFPVTNNLVFPPAMFDIGQKIFDNSEIVNIEQIQAKPAPLPVEPVRPPAFLGTLPVLVANSLPRSRNLAKYLAATSD